MSGTQSLRRRLAEAVLSQVGPDIPGISAHVGEDYEDSSDPEAVTYRKIGGKFSWLAFAFAPWRMWDLHVGVVEVDHDTLSLGFHISERAAATLMPELEKLASQIESSVIHQVSAVEYQANLPRVPAIDSDTDELVRRILDLCVRVAPVAKDVGLPPGTAVS